MIHNDEYVMSLIQIEEYVMTLIHNIDSKWWMCCDSDLNKFTMIKLINVATLLTLIH